MGKRAVQAPRKARRRWDRRQVAIMAVAVLIVFSLIASAFASILYGQ